MARPPVGDDARPRRTPREAGQDAVARAQETAERARLTFRRLSGLDRSGPPPPQTLKGQPLNPWTLPNAIGFVRLALIPVFLAFAFSSGDGISPTVFSPAMAKNRLPMTGQTPARPSQLTFTSAPWRSA